MDLRHVWDGSKLPNMNKFILKIILVWLSVFIIIAGLEYRIEVDILRGPHYFLNIAATFLQNILFMLVGLFAIKEINNYDIFETLSLLLKKGKFYIWIMAIMVGLLLKFSSEGLTDLFSKVLPISDYYSDITSNLISTENKILYVLFTGLWTPFCEEIFFRGFCYGNLRVRYNVTISILINILIFAIFHPILVYIPSIILFSLILCMSYELTKNLLIPIVIHATVNISLVIFSL
jgi:membrane protease YdiL (CAAX protease family)